MELSEKPSAQDTHEFTYAEQRRRAAHRSRAAQYAADRRRRRPSRAALRASIQPVAVHLLALYGALVRGWAPADALKIQERALRADLGARGGRFRWLEPPSFAGTLSEAPGAVVDTPAARPEAPECEKRVGGVGAILSERDQRLVRGFCRTVTDCAGNCYELIFSRPVEG
jgi:hypothetical protein